MSENESPRKDIKALIEELRPFFVGLGLGLALVVILVLLGLALGLPSDVVLPGHDFPRPR